MRYFFLLLLGLSFLFSCEKSQRGGIQDDIKTQNVSNNFDHFNGYLRNYSKAPISNCGKIYIELNQMLSDSIINNVDLQSLFRVHPQISGKVSVQRDRRSFWLIHEGLKVDQEYTVQFHIGAIMKVPEDMQFFEWTIKRKVQSWDLEMIRPIVKNMESVSYEARIRAQDCVRDIEVLRKSISAYQEGNSAALPIEIKPIQNNNYFSLQIDDIERKDEASWVTVYVDGKALGIEETFEERVPIPAKSDFSIYKVIVQSKQKISVVFSDPLKANQDLSGLFEIGKLSINRIEQDFNTVHLFLSKPSYGYFPLKVYPGIQNLAGFPFKVEEVREVFLKPPNPRVAIAEDGNILPPNGGWKIPIESQSCTAFRLRILEINPQNIHRLYQENVNIYESQSGLENLGRIELDTIFKLDNASEPFDLQVSNLDLSNFVQRKEGTIYKLLLSIPEGHNAFPCKEKKLEYIHNQIDKINFDQPWIRIRGNENQAYNWSSQYTYSYTNNTYYQDRYQSNYYPCNKNLHKHIFDQRLIVCTDIGIIAKYQPEKETYTFFASSLNTANPLPNVKLVLYDFQGNRIGQSFSNSNGISNIKSRQIAFRLEAQYRNSRTHMVLSGNQTLSLSSFAVGGKSSGEQDVYFYGDRGVWRPGDSIYITAILNEAEKFVPASVMAKFSLYNPKDVLIKEWKTSSFKHGVYAAHFDTDINDPTGIWRLEMELGGKQYKHNVRVETIRPNRLKMQMNFADKEMIHHNDSLQANIDVKWMHGLEAAGIAVKMEEFEADILNPFGTQYQGFAFSSNLGANQTYRGLAVNDITDDKGRIDFDVKTYQHYQGMIRKAYHIRAFEPGGAFSTDVKTIRFSPFASYVGMKLPGGSYHKRPSIQAGESIQLICLNEDGMPLEGEFEISIHPSKYSRYWYQVGETHQRYAAIKDKLEHKAKTYTVQVGEKGHQFTLRGHGKMTIEVKNLSSGHTVQRELYLYEPYAYDESGDVQQVEILPFKMDKTSYTIGETAKFSLPAASEGTYFVSFEKGGEIIDQRIYKASKNNREVSMIVQEQMVPNVYVHVHYVQAYRTAKPNSLMRKFGIKGFSVSDPNTFLKPQLKIPQEVETDQSFKVEISEESGRGMTYTLAIVDEGLLDVTQFGTPDPHQAFFGEQALEVKTWDMYRDIFNKFYGEYSNLLAIGGGDGSSKNNPQSQAQRFPPVVKFLGPFYLPANKQKSHSIEIADYVGSVKAMVVATNGKAFGSTDAEVSVIKPLMTYSTLPRVLGPDEQIELPVSIFGMKAPIDRAEIKLEVSDNLEIVGSNSKEVSFETIGEKDLSFTIKTKKSIGIARVKVQSKSKKYQYEEIIELDIRPSTTWQTKVDQSLLKSQSEEEFEYEAIGMDGTNSTSLLLSTGLNFDFKKYSDQLKAYPHGCLEQTVSKIFPQIYLYRMGLVEGTDSIGYIQNYKQAIDRLESMQTSNGGLAYWPGGNQSHAFSSVYALHFWVEAKRLGFDVPKNLYQNLVQHIYQDADQWSIRSDNSYRYFRQSTMTTQAYRLYVLALADKPCNSAMNRMRLMPNLASASQWILANAYLYLKQEEAANFLVQNATTKVEDYKELGYAFGSPLRDLNFIARYYIDAGDIIKAKTIIDDMMKSFEGQAARNRNTQEIAQCLITFSKFVADLDQTDEPTRVTVEWSDGSSNNFSIGKNLTEVPLPQNMQESGSFKVRNSGKQNVFLSLVQKGLPLQDTRPAEANEIAMKVNYTNPNGESIQLKDLKQGDDFIAEFSVTHPGDRMNYENLALSTIFPSCWEPMNPRIYNLNFDNGMQYTDYVDYRDDRVYVYFDLKKGESKSFKVFLNATYAGESYKPGYFVEAMYDPTIFAKTAGQKIVLK